MKPQNTRLRLITPNGLQIRAEGDEPSGKLFGYAAKFGQEYELFPGLIETIEPGAFARTLEEQPDVRALLNHDTTLLLGRTTAGTLSLSEDETGLAFELDPPDTSAGRDAKVSVGRGDLTGCSFGFCVREEKVTNREDGTVVRTLLDVDLYEISLCTFPAYTDTEVALRSALKHAMVDDRAATRAWIEWAHLVLETL